MILTGMLYVVQGEAAWKDSRGFYCRKLLCRRTVAPSLPVKVYTLTGRCELLAGRPAVGRACAPLMILSLSLNIWASNLKVKDSEIYAHSTSSLCNSGVFFHLYAVAPLMRCRKLDLPRFKWFESMCFQSGQEFFFSSAIVVQVVNCCWDITKRHAAQDSHGRCWSKGEKTYTSTKILQQTCILQMC